MAVWQRVAAARQVAATAKATTTTAFGSAPTAPAGVKVYEATFKDGRLVRPTTAPALAVPDVRDNPITRPLVSPIIPPPSAPLVHTIPFTSTPGGIEANPQPIQPITSGHIWPTPAEQAAAAAAARKLAYAPKPDGTIRRIGGAVVSSPSPAPSMETPDMNTGLNTNRPVTVESSGGGGGGFVAPPVNVNVAAAESAPGFDWKKWLPLILALLAVAVWYMGRKK